MTKMMKWACWAVTVCCLFPCPALSEESGKDPAVQLEKIVVKEKKGTDLVEVDQKSPTTEDTIPKSGIDKSTAEPSRLPGASASAT
jgi:hypothetical protein